MGIDTIEAGFPIASEGDFQAVQAIAGAVTKMTVAGLARCQKKTLIVPMKLFIKPSIPRSMSFSNE